MLTYGQLIKTNGKTRKRFWYICGDDSALIQDSIEIAKDHVYSGVDSVCLEIFFGGNGTEERIRTFLQLPYFDERKLAIVYESEKIDNWDRIVSDLEASDASTFIIMVSGGPPSDSSSINRLITKNKYGRAVKCSKMSQDAVRKWVVSRIDISDTALNNLLSRYNNDNEWLLNKIRILEYLDAPEITSGIIDRICGDTGIDKFEESLIRFDKQQCFLYIKDIGTDNVNLARIIKDTQNLTLLRTAMGHNSKQIRPLEDKTGLTRKQIEGYMGEISYYDLTAATRCFKAITTLYTALQRNDRAAYLALVCRW